MTPQEYQKTVKAAMDSLDDIFSPEQIEQKNKTKSVILKLLHEFGFKHIKLEKK